MARAKIVFPQSRVMRGNCFHGYIPEDAGVDMIANDRAAFVDYKENDKPSIRVPCVTQETDVFSECKNVSVRLLPGYYLVPRSY